MNKQNDSASMKLYGKVSVFFPNTVDNSVGLLIRKHPRKGNASFERGREMAQ
jgi:hypothetical protein